MKITLDNHRHLPDLLAYLRSCGCIAYLDRAEHVITAVPPSGSVAATVRALAEAWAAGRGIAVTIAN